MTTLWTSTLIADSGQSSYWNSVQFVSGSTKTYLSPDLVGGSMVTLSFARTTPATLRDDLMQMSFHFAVEAGPGAPCVALTGTQAASIETLLDTFWTTMKALTPNTITLSNYTWRDYRADFPRGTGNTLKYSPAWRTTTKNVVATLATPDVPHQIASTVTQATGSRRHWGRSYMPGIGLAQLGGAGRLATSYVDGLAGATRALFNSAAGLPAITNPWIWSARFGGAMSIREVHVDDIPDVQRRRRDKQVAYRRSYTS